MLCPRFVSFRGFAFQGDGVMHNQNFAAPGLRPRSSAVRFASAQQTARSIRFDPKAIAHGRRPPSHPPRLSRSADPSVHLPHLPHNQILSYLRRADDRLTPTQGLFALDLSRGPELAQWKPIRAPIDAPTLLFLHGTFSNTDHFLSELTSNTDGRDFLSRCASTYPQILALGHATLAVSPLLNAFDLSRLFARVRSPIDVVAHSRGGLVARWWLDGLGGSLLGDRRVILVGAPMAGTSLASPDRIRATMNLLACIAHASAAAAGIASTITPFMLAPAILCRVLKHVADLLAHTPLADAAVALIPGLAGQSRVGNNYELLRLREAPVLGNTRYYAVTANFEPADPGWRFWQRFRKSHLLDSTATFVFAAENDLVVDTTSMHDLVGPSVEHRLEGALHYGTTPKVHHCNYFRQPRTIHTLSDWLLKSAPKVRKSRPKRPARPRPKPDA